MRDDDREIRRLHRRTVLKWSATAAAGVATVGAPAVMRGALGQSAFNWKRLNGEAIEVLLTKSPPTDLLMAHHKEFEALTGIKVGAEQVPEQQQRQKLVIEFNSGRTSFDVASIAWHVQKRLVGRGKWLEDLRPFLADGSLTAPDYDFQDFGAASVGYATQADGRLDTLPLDINYWALFWNKDLFEQKGIAYPQSYDEIVAAAARIHDPANGIYGFTARGLKNANVPVWTSFLLGWDKEAVDASQKLTTAGPEAIAAAELFKKLMRDYTPPGIAGFNWNECQTSFSQGKIGMWADGIGFAPALEDPTKSRIAGKVGYGVMPMGPKARHSGLFGDGLGVSSSSRRKQAAYLYCQWATGKAMQARMLTSGAGAPCRNSTFTDPAAVSQVKLPRGWFDNVLESAKIGRAGLPVIVPVSEFRDTFGIALSNMIQGADAAAELKKATEAFQPVLDKSEQG